MSDWPQYQPWLQHPRLVVHPVYMHGTPMEAATLQLRHLIEAMTARTDRLGRARDTEE